VQALIDRALAIDDEDDHEYWAIVHEMQRLGGTSTFEAMAELCQVRSDAHRRLGLNVLAQLEYESGKPFLEESLPIVVSLCSRDEHDAVLVAAVGALGNLHDERALETVLSLGDHPNADVRWGVATSLPNVAGDPPDPRAVELLILLTEDENRDVRDWATFGLGTQLDVDNARVRGALLDRLYDSDGDTAGEAIVGLAARNDTRVVEIITQELARPNVGNLIVEAAGKMGDSRFLPFLYALKDQGWERDDPRRDWLDNAIRACLEGPEWRSK